MITGTARGAGRHRRAATVGEARKPLGIAGTNLRRTFRERSSFFFVFAFPMLLILVLGMAYGGSFQPRVGLVTNGSGPLAEHLADQLAASAGIDVQLLAGESDMVGKVERGELEAGLVIPSGYDNAVRSATGTTELRYVARPGQQGQQVASIVGSVVGEEAARLRTVRFTTAETRLGFDSAVAAVAAAGRRVPAISVTVRTTGDADFPRALGRFDVGAGSQLLLFIFITSMTSASALIETRRLGVSRRMLATPTRASTVVLGEALGRFAVAVVQGGFIMLGSALIFGVRWGDPLAAITLMLSFALVASGAGLLLGALVRTTQQAIAIGLLLGLGLGALGGTMMPLEFFSPTMRSVAHLTPHAWAVEGFADLIRRDADLADLAPRVGVLLAASAVLFGLASWRFRRSITA
ncbi:MAG TPA: ABC transporter permease [Micromonosporaceae bacterium]